MPVPVCSVIVPSYRSEGTIRACLQSLSKQDFPLPFEVIVVDSSPDGTPEIVRRDFPEVRLIQLSQRADPAVARNTGARQAQAEVLAFIDSDCQASPGWLRRLYETISQDYDAAGGAIANANPDSLVSWAGYFCEFREFLPLGVPRDVANLTLGNAAYRRDDFWAAGGFPPGCFPQEDQVFHHAFTGKGGRIRFDPGILVYHHHRSNLDEFLLHQRRIGRANAQVVSRLGLPGVQVVNARWAPLAIPLLTVLRFFRTAKACWPIENGLILRRPALAWYCLRGIWSWGLGFLAEARQQQRLREGTGAVSSR